MVSNCSCHISPPCGRCMEAWLCVVCGEVEHPDDGGELYVSELTHEETFICAGCVRKRDKEGEVGDG